MSKLFICELSGNWSNAAMAHGHTQPYRSKPDSDIEQEVRHTLKFHGKFQWTVWQPPNCWHTVVRLSKKLTSKLLMIIMVSCAG